MIVGQSELDALIDSGGGGACPISAALIAMQTLRSMAGQSSHPQPHRYALQLFQSHPELKKGRISNERFVKLFGWVSSKIDGYGLQVETVSAKNSSHTDSGPFWQDEDGPELAVRGGELCVLAYTVTQPGGNVRGRHFVLLKQRSETQIRVLNPQKPMKGFKPAATPLSLFAAQLGLNVAWSWIFFGMHRPRLGVCRNRHPVAGDRGNDGGVLCEIESRGWTHGAVPGMG